MAKICGSCGKENTDSAKFCVVCGNKLDAVISEGDQVVEAEQVTTEEKVQENVQENVNAEPVNEPKQEAPAAAVHMAKASKINFKPSNYQWFDFQNPIALILYGIGALIFVGGFILGIIMGFVHYDYYDYYSEHTVFSFSTTLYYWLRAFIAGTAIIAAGEIINVLQKILNKRD